MVVSSTSMKVASATRMAISQGLVAAAPLAGGAPALRRGVAHTRPRHRSKSAFNVS